MAEYVAINVDKAWVDVASPSVNVNHTAANLAGFVVEAGHAHDCLYATPLIITSGDDGTHTPNSAHYHGDAVDLRSHDKTPEDQLLFGLVMARLQAKWKVVILDERATVSPHWHVQTAESIGG